MDTAAYDHGLLHHAAYTQTAAFYDNISGKRSENDLAVAVITDTFHALNQKSSAYFKSNPAFAAAEFGFCIHQLSQKSVRKLTAF